MKRIFLLGIVRTSKEVRRAPWKASTGHAAAIAEQATVADAAPVNAVATAVPASVAPTAVDAAASASSTASRARTRAASSLR